MYKIWSEESRPSSFLLTLLMMEGFSLQNLRKRCLQDLTMHIVATMTTGTPNTRHRITATKCTHTHIG